MPHLRGKWSPTNAILPTFEIPVIQLFCQDEVPSRTKLRFIGQRARGSTLWPESPLHNESPHRSVVQVVSFFLCFAICRQPKQEEMAAAKRTAERQKYPKERFFERVTDTYTSKIDRSAMRTAR